MDQQEEDDGDYHPSEERRRRSIRLQSSLQQQQLPSVSSTSESLSFISSELLDGDSDEISSEADHHHHHQQQQLIDDGVSSSSSVEDFGAPPPPLPLISRQSPTLQSSMMEEQPSSPAGAIAEAAASLPTTNDSGTDQTSACTAASHDPSSSSAAHSKSKKKSQQQQQRRRLLYKLVLGFILFTNLLTYTCTTYYTEFYEQLKFQSRLCLVFARSIYNLARVNRRKQRGLKLQLSEFQATNSSSTTMKRAWPDPPIDQFDNSTKIIWAYWHSGYDNLPPLARIAYQSWKASHPSWTIIILSDTNYHLYVPSYHVPSTFELLKVQYRSDIVRLSVLARYGGAYLDMTTVVFQSLDGIWDQELSRGRRVDGSSGGKEEEENLQGEEGRDSNDGGEELNRIFVPTVLELGTMNSSENESSSSSSSSGQSSLSTTTTPSSSSTTLGLVTNSVILSPRPSNPIILKFLDRILTYSENPASSATELKSRPEFKRVHQYMTDKNKLGILGKDGTLLYSAHLWIFTDLVLFDEEMEAGRYFVDLPALRWTYDFIILPHMFEKYGEGGEDVVLEHQRQQQQLCGCGCGCGGMDDGDVVEEEVNDDHQQATSAATMTCAASSSPSSCCLQRIEEQHQNLRIHDWGSWHILKRAMGGMIQWQEFDDPNLATYLSRNVVMFKTSTDGGTLHSQLSYEELMSLQSTYGRLNQMATKGTGLNATLEGARPFGYGAPPIRSFELDRDDDVECGCRCGCSSGDDNIII